MIPISFNCLVCLIWIGADSMIKGFFHKLFLLSVKKKYTKKPVGKLFQRAKVSFAVPPFFTREQ
ncbi:hypothetical protein D920_01862 [Enterococcus faecalis 13-SD-W-01]|nr:hypothetical protein D920_01862 [Enterococcus faecalis 13-SD-W-01]